jgi:hypothetical protein
VNDRKENLKQSNRPRFWQAHVKAMTQSGLSRAEYCRRRDLSYHAFTYWQRKLAKPSNNPITLVPVPLPIGIHSGATTDQVPLKILLPGKLAIVVGDNFSDTTLNRLLTLLENR